MKHTADVKLDQFLNLMLNGRRTQNVTEGIRFTVWRH